MADLRLVGVHDDGEHLLLSGPGGEIFTLPIDEALRVAATRTPHRLPSRDAAPAGTRLSPREIQAQIRAGASADEVAQLSGLPIEQVRRYEGPVLAERDHIARLARGIVVATAVPNHDGYRSAFGDNPATLEEMVSHRLLAFGVDRSTLAWDAWRRSDGTWTVTADFNPGTAGAASSIGEPAPAQWTFHAGRKSLLNANRWAQQLSELEPVDGPVPARRLSAVSDRPFDFETDVADDEPGSGVDGPDAVPADEPDDYPGDGLLNMLRSRRGQRLGLDEDADDELASMLGAHVPAAHPRDDAPGGDAGDAPDAEAGILVDPRTHARVLPLLSLAPSLPQDEADSIALHHVDTNTREITLSGEPADRRGKGFAAVNSSAAGAAGEEPMPSDSEVTARFERKASAKPKRSSVPSWDEIVFGTKGD
ncbi:septation protein SepH [Specibacter cremeus]|uniref:septation protein SepH n=1 Tax=Specibacter cremeus TaxID=1629051 RepID=UPI000F775CA7|nr:septation protein SepH [Specibacter cremeus]